MSSAVEVGQVYVVRCVENGQEAWRRLLVCGAVPAPLGEKTSHYTVQTADGFSETREIARLTLENECDRES
jgi:hypothetical protein